MESKNKKGVALTLLALIFFAVFVYLYITGDLPHYILGAILFFVTVCLVPGVWLLTGIKYNPPEKFGEAEYPNKEQSPVSGFDDVVGIIQRESIELAKALQDIEQEYGGGIGDDQLYTEAADIIHYGINARKTDPIQEVISALEFIIKSKHFLNKTERTEIEIVDRKEGILYGKLTDGHHGVVKGLIFDLHVREVPTETESSETISKPAATVEITSIDDRVCSAEVLYWGKEYSAGDILNKNVVLKFPAEHLEEVDVGLKELEETYKQLQRLSHEGRYN